MQASALKPLSSMRIAVLAGGDSAERNVSLKSGAAVLAALKERGHHATHIDPLEVALPTIDWSRFDVVFVALHGTFGEDGQVQNLLEEASIPFTGSDADASRLAFSKSATKERFLQVGVPTPPYILIHESDDAAHIQEQAKKIGYPLVVKPNAQGSSLGVSLVAAQQELPSALANCFHFDSFGLLETAILGTEWTVSLMDDLLLPVILIETQRPYFDYQAKYVDHQTAYRFEFDLPPSVVSAIEDAGRRAAENVGTRGLARVDILLDKFHRPWVLEVNTVPGLTRNSLVPKAARRMGIEFAELCERAIASCLSAARQPSRAA